MKNKHNMHAGINAQYNYYIQTLNDKQKDILCKHDNSGNSSQYSYFFTRKEYTEALKLLNENISDKIVQGKKMNLGRCGDIYIVGARRNIEVNKEGKLIKKNMGVDWKSTLDLWKETYPGVEQKIVRGVNMSYKHIKNKPKVYYDNKYEYKLNWNIGSLKTRPTGQKYYYMVTNDRFRKKLTDAIGDSDGTQTASKIYDLKDYRNKRLNNTVKRIFKLN